MGKYKPKKFDFFTELFLAGRHTWAEHETRQGPWPSSVLDIGFILHVYLQLRHFIVYAKKYLTLYIDDI